MVRVRVREKMMVDVEIVVRTVLLVTVVSVVTAVCRTIDSESKKSVRLLLMLVMLLSTTTLVTLTMLTTSWVLVSVVSEVSVDVVVDVGAVDTIVRVTWTVLKDTVTAVCTQMSGLEFADTGVVGWAHCMLAHAFFSAASCWIDGWSSSRSGSSKRRRRIGRWPVSRQHHASSSAI